MLHPYCAAPRAQLCRPTCARDPKSAASRCSKHFPFPGLRSSHNFTYVRIVSLPMSNASQTCACTLWTESTQPASNIIATTSFLQQNQVPFAKLSCSSNVISHSAAMPSFFKNYCSTKLMRRSSKSACDEHPQLQHFLQQEQRCCTCSLAQCKYQGRDQSLHTVIVAPATVVQPQKLCEDQDQRRPGLDKDHGYAPWRIKGRHIGVGGERMRGVHLGDVGSMKACVVSTAG